MENSLPGVQKPTEFPDQLKHNNASSRGPIMIFQLALVMLNCRVPTPLAACQPEKILSPG